MLLAFIDFDSGLAYFPLSHRPHMNENFPSTPQPPLRFMQWRKKNRWNKIYVNKDSVSRMNKLGENATKKTFVRSSTNTAERKLSIGPTPWLVLLIEIGAGVVLVVETIVTSVGRKFAVRFAAVFLAITLTRLTLFSLFSAVKLKNLAALFSLMKNRKRRDKRLE